MEARFCEIRWQLTSKLSALQAVFGTRTTALVAAIPAVAQWRRAPLPKGLSAVEVRTLLGAFDRHAVGGRRDYAIARCYVDLELRTSEIGRLRLDDFDWREGVVHVRGKSRRTDVLPLPQTTGRAILPICARGDEGRQIGRCSCAFVRRSIGLPVR